MYQNLVKSKLLNGEINLGEAVKLPSFACQSFMTDDDKLHMRSEELRPKILELLKTRKEITITALLNLLDADILELRLALTKLRKEGKVAFLK